MIQPELTLLTERPKLKHDCTYVIAPKAADAPTEIDKQLDEPTLGELQKLIQAKKFPTHLTVFASASPIKLYALPFDFSKVSAGSSSPLLKLREFVARAIDALAHEPQWIVDLSFAPADGDYSQLLWLHEWVTALVMQRHDPGVFKSRDHEPPKQLPKVAFYAPLIENNEFDAACRQALALGRAINTARSLADLPPNVCTPSFLAQEAQRVAAKGGFSVHCRDEKELKQLEMETLLSVAKGSEQPPYLIEFHYQGADEGQQPLALVGKAVTFDTGGISLKPAASMDEMKFDMCGGATVFACMQMAAELRLPINLVGLVACVENMPSGRASRPGDIVRSMSGLSVEILNTDAEGRLILCDTLTYSKRFKPRWVIDFATLTGACVIALGKEASGLFSNHQPLADSLLQAGAKSADRLWQLPIWDEYGDLMKSRCADIANVGGREAGSITAAWFLSQFADEFNWAHLDIAGTAWFSGKKSRASGRPVRMMHAFLRQVSLNG